MKKRLDILLVEKGLSPSREKAKAQIMAGEVYVNGQKEEKAGSTFPEEAPITVKGKALPYVSRGGLKLAKAMECFPISLEGALCMDIGASTGGFTDCMLQNGASKVYAIDVGYGQLAWQLRSDPRVVCMEKTNIRYVTREQVPEPIDFASIDVSFISLTLVLPVAHQLLRPLGEVVCLIKPQFEAGREKVGKKGVVRDARVHLETIMKVICFARENGFSILGLTYSPVKGPEGNIEYLLHLQRQGEELGRERGQREPEGREPEQTDTKARETQTREQKTKELEDELLTLAKGVVEAAHEELDRPGGGA